MEEVKKIMHRRLVCVRNNIHSPFLNGNLRSPDQAWERLKKSLISDLESQKESFCTDLVLNRVDVLNSVQKFLRLPERNNS